MPSVTGRRQSWGGQTPVPKPEAQALCWTRWKSPCFSQKQGVQLLWKILGVSLESRASSRSRQGCVPPPQPNTSRHWASVKGAGKGACCRLFANPTHPERGRPVFPGAERGRRAVRSTRRGSAHFPPGGQVRLETAVPQLSAPTGSSARPGPCLAEAAVSAQAASRNLLPAAAPSSRGPAQPEQQACGGARVRAGWSQQRACPALGPATPSLEDAQLAEAKGTRGPQQLFPGIPWAGPQSPRNGLVAQSPSRDYKSGAPGSLGPAISLQPTSTPGPTERASLTQASRAREAPNCWPSPGDPSCTGRCWS